MSHDISVSTKVTNSFVLSKNSITLGTGINLNKNLTLDFAYSAMFFEKRKIENNIGSSSSASIDGQYHTFDNIYMLTLTFKL
jgi:long-subunit fatty acid transport protein